MARIEKGHSPDRNGYELTLADLPPPDTRRWFPSRKILVARGVQVGLLSFGEASKRYSLSLEEFAGWQKLAGISNTRRTISTIPDALRIALSGANGIAVSPTAMNIDHAQFPLH